MLKRLTALGVSIVFSVTCNAASAELLVVVSVEAPFTRLASDELVDIYLGRRAQIGRGLQVVPLDQSEGSVERSEFYTRYIGQTPAQLKSHWAKLIFTGRGQPPQALSDSRAVVERLVGDITALGYIDAAFLDDRLRVITIE